MTQSQLVRNATAEIEQTLTKEQQLTWQSLTDHFDFIFNGLHGGAGENGAVQGMLEMLGIPYNGSSVFASALCMDKYKTASFLQASGFAIPRNYLIQKTQWTNDKEKELQNITAQIKPPFIVKPPDDGCSVLVSQALTKKDLIQQINALFATEKNSALIEEHVAGMELTVGVIGNENPEALPPSQAVAQKGILSIEEKFLPGAGENQTPAPLPEKALKLVQHTVQEVFKAVGCTGYARIDCFYQTAQESPTNKEGVVILEINTLPGLTPATCIFHQAAETGLKPMDFIDHIITLGLQAHHAPTFTPSLVSQKRNKQIEQ